MAQPLSKEQIVAYELWGIADRMHEHWWALAPHMIKPVEVGRDLSAGDTAKAMNQCGRQIGRRCSSSMSCSPPCGRSLNQPG